MRFLLIFILFLAIPLSTHAQDLFPKELLPTADVDPQHVLKGGEYQLELSPLEEESKQIEKATQIVDTLSPEQRKEFTIHGYTVKQTKGEMTLSLSVGRINLGTIAGDGKHTGNIEINVSTDIPSGYTLRAVQETPEDSIWEFTPTQCDDATCTPQKAERWQDEKSYGFGYAVVGTDAVDDFKNEKYFRPFRGE
ncbi:hypothetical protein BH09PAT1_BH09PAT1_6930 [soil metagenome]